MKRLAALALAAGALVSTAYATPASAADGGCSGKVDVACNETPCAPDNPCTINVCFVYVAPRCVV